MKSKSLDGMVCSIARALETIGDRWAILILRDLSQGLRRYEDLRQSSGITNATLSDRLKHLEENDLIERHQYQSNPARYEYYLTRKGREIRLLTQALVQIGDKWAVAEDQCPPLRFVDRKTGRAVKLSPVDAETELYRVPGHPFTTALFVLTCAAIVASTIIAYPTNSVFGFIILAAGIPVYLYWSRKSRIAPTTSQ